MSDPGTAPTAQPRRLNWLPNWIRSCWFQPLAFSGKNGKKQQHRWLRSAGLIALFVLFWLFVPPPLYRHGGPPEARLKAVSDTRTALLAGLIGIGALLTFRLSSLTYRLSERGQITDRYAKAIEHLGSNKREVRLGGIYALEQIAQDYSRYHSTVVEVLSAYAREDSTRHPRAPGSPVEDGSSGTRRLAVDLQAAITVLGRLSETSSIPRRSDLSGIALCGAFLPYAQLHKARLQGAMLNRINLSHARLSEADLTEAQLNEANLSSANLHEAHLSGAWLFGARLTKAWMPNVDLTNAKLQSADLSNARLKGAKLDNAILLQGAKLSDADLEGAKLRGAHLEGAKLRGAYLRGADLTGVRLNGADLTDADLTDADLTDADLTDADLTRIAGTDKIRSGHPVALTA